MSVDKIYYAKSTFNLYFASTQQKANFTSSKDTLLNKNPLGRITELSKKDNN